MVLGRDLVVGYVDPSGIPLYEIHAIAFALASCSGTTAQFQCLHNFSRACHFGCLKEASKSVQVLLNGI